MPYISNLQSLENGRQAGLAWIVHAMCVWWLSRPHLDLGECARVEQRLDKCPDGLEHHGCIDDADAPKHLWVVVLVVLCQRVYQALHLTRQVAEPHTWSADKHTAEHTVMHIAQRHAQSTD